MNLQVIQAPFWKEEEKKEEEPLENKVSVEDSDKEVYKSRSYRKNPQGYTNEMVKELGDDWSTVGESKVRNGDYVVTPMFKGVYHVKNFFLFLC